MRNFARNRTITYNILGAKFFIECSFINELPKKKTRGSVLQNLRRVRRYARRTHCRRVQLTPYVFPHVACAPAGRAVALVADRFRIQPTIRFLTFISDESPRYAVVAVVLRVKL